LFSRIKVLAHEVFEPADDAPQDLYVSVDHLKPEEPNHAKQEYSVSTSWNFRIA